MTTIDDLNPDELEELDDFDATTSADATAPDPRSPADGTTQWRAETLQLVNWGGFQGHAQFDFDLDSTLISGASGTGKSTLLDAYIALMMPADTPFNGASNDAVAGRARSAEQRNLLSYLRGKTDSVADETGREVDTVLRGERGSTWGAVAMTFLNDLGQRFTALRVYYVPARATRPDDITMRMATYDNALNLTELAPLADQMFAPKAMKAAFPGLDPASSYGSFAARLHTRLGIGANGDGTKALRLLVRIQSGHQIRTVDELYKDMVLERPATYAAADRAIEHFDALEAAYMAMTTEQQKAELLAPIHGLHERLTAARDQIETLDTVGLTSDGDTPLTLWSLRTERTLLEDAVDENRIDRRTNDEALSNATTREKSLATELDNTRAEHRDAGGATLELLSGQIEAEERIRTDRSARRDTLVAATAVLAAPLESRTDFDALRAAAEAFLDQVDTRSDDLATARDDIARSQWPHMERRRILAEEKASLEGRTGRVPKHLDDLRRTAAHAAGMSVEELPFLAELIDVADTESRWRTAIETVLAGPARQVLVPANQLEAFSAAIDPLRLRGRLTFIGAETHTNIDPPVDARHVAGKLRYADGPFTGWIQRYLAATGRNAECVETSADLAGTGYKVTVSGQTRMGSRGSHGRNDTSAIIGFSNVEALHDIDTELEHIDTQLDALTTQLTNLADEAALLTRRRTAYEAVTAYQWSDIDVAASDDLITSMRERYAQIEASDDRLRALGEAIESLEADLETARRRRYDAERRKKDLDDKHLLYVDRLDVIGDDIARIEDTARVLLDVDTASRLDAEFAAAVEPGDLASLPDFPTNLMRLRNRLTATLAGARDEVRRTEAELERTFASYQHTWEDPNLGRSAAAYRDYALVLDNILSTGLHERRAEWRSRLTEWSGQDLVPLSGAMEGSVAEIEDRLEPINAILSGLEFGAGKDRLRIRLRRLTPDNVTVFRRDLRALSSAATKELTEAQMEARFADLQRFMGRIRRRDDPRANPELTDRDRLLDVRRHVEITAERLNLDGKLLSTHSSLGGKSGGESQELVAFIVGAALRFRLGDELRDRPRFAPVFLDEGFVKSDSEFAGRAVTAWKGLGFQLIVGAPLDKVTALEPHMGRMIAITKSTTTGYSFVHPIRDRGSATPVADFDPGLG